MPRTLSLLAVLKKVDAKGVKSLSNAQWNTFLASDTEPNEIKDKIKKLEGYEEKFVAYDETGELIVEDNQAMIDRFKQRTGRAKGRESFKVKKTKINIGEFLGKDRTPDKSPDKSQNPDISGIFDDDEEKKRDVGPKGMESKVGRLARILRDTRGRVLKLEEEKKKGPSKKLVTDGLDETVNLIAEKVTSIEDTLKDQIKVDVENNKLQTQKLEDEKRDKEETRLGKVTGFLKGAADKIIAPVQGIFGQIFGFIKRLILGKIFLNILKWFGNPENQGKINSLIKFFTQNWKKLLSLYLIFGTGIGRFVRFLTKVAIKGTIKLIALLAKIAAAKKIKGARGIAKFFGGKKGAILGTALTAAGTVGAYVGINKMLGGGDDKEGGDGEVQNFNKGGKVRGQGDKDTVPAMLTPGEFVMSKGAVQQYGVETMEAMNAAAGGTNVPVLMPDKKRKGFPGGGRPYAPTAPTMGYGMGQVQPDQFVFNKTEFISKSTTTTRNGEVIDHKREKSMTDIGGNIAVEDMKEHQTQLVESLRKVPGYEKINFMDVMQYPDGKGRLVGMPEEILYPILNASDAGKASKEKRRAAQEKFLVDNNLIKPDGGVKAYSYYDGKLKVDGETRDAVLEEGAIRQFNSGGLVSNVFNSISNFNGGGLVSNLSNSISDSISNFNGGGLVSNLSNSISDSISNSISNFNGGGLVSNLSNSSSNSSSNLSNSSSNLSNSISNFNGGGLVSNSISDSISNFNGGGLVSNLSNSSSNLSNSISNFNGGGLVSNTISNFNGGGLASNVFNSISNFNGGGQVQGGRGRLKDRPEVLRSIQNATLQKGKVTSGNMNLSEAQKLKREIEIEDEEEMAMMIYGINSPEHNEVIKKRLIEIKGIPPEALYIRKSDGTVQIKGYSSVDGKTTFSGEKRRSISNKSQKNPANFSQPQGSGGGLMGGIKRAAGGFADYATLGMFDFDKRNRKGAPKDFGIRRIAGGLADNMTMGLTDFDKRGRGIGQFNPIGGGEDKAWGAADEQAKRGEAQSGFGLKRGVGGVMDQMTGNMFDFDKQSGGGLLRKTANAIGGLFGKGDKVMGAESKTKEIKIPAEGLESILIKIASKQDIKTPVGQPSLSGPKITVIPERKSVNTPAGTGGGSNVKAIPKFDAGHGSSRKATQLGITR